MNDTNFAILHIWNSSKRDAKMHKRSTQGIKYQYNLKKSVCILMQQNINLRVNYT